MTAKTTELHDTIRMLLNQTPTMDLMKNLPFDLQIPAAEFEPRPKYVPMGPDDCYRLGPYSKAPSAKFDFHTGLLSISLADLQKLISDMAFDSKLPNDPRKIELRFEHTKRRNGIYVYGLGFESEDEVVERLSRIRKKMLSGHLHKAESLQKELEKTDLAEIKRQAQIAQYNELRKLLEPSKDPFHG